MNNLIIKNNELFGKIRFAQINGKEYAVGIDVANALGYERAGKAINDHCKGVLFWDSLKIGGYPAKMIPEGDIYRLIIKSRLSQAQQFEKWVFDEVLPQIRQTGGYIPTNEQDSEEDILAKAVLIAQKTIERKNAIIEKQNKQLVEQEPLVGFANQIGNSADSIEVGVFAKLVKDENIKIGRNRLFQWFRDNKYLMKDNTPYQSKIEQGLFEVTEYTYNTPYKQNCIGRKTTITGKGQIYFVEKLRKEFY